MAKVKDIFELINAFAPTARKMDFDNVGILVGDGENDVRRVIAALDITDAVIEEAVKGNAELIVSHHPIIFNELKKVTADDLVGRKVLTLARNNISAICMHTNLDVSRGGVNDALADALKITGRKLLITEGTDADGEAYGLGMYGAVPEQTMTEFLPFVKTALNANGLRYIDSGKPVCRVAVCGGAGGSELETAKMLGCDTYVTSDIKYNGFLDAAELGINLIDAGHFPTENVVVSPIADMIRKAFPNLCVTISQCHRQPEQFF